MSLFSSVTAEMTAHNDEYHINNITYEEYLQHMVAMTTEAGLPCDEDVSAFFI